MNPIFLPMLALVLITFLVWLKLLIDRVSEIQGRKIRLNLVGTSTQASQVLKNLRSSDNYKNLFELPVLFYLFCLVVSQIQWNSMLVLILAWIFVIGRALHSLIQCTYNRTMHRFPIFVLSSLTLFAMWVLLGIEILQRL